MLPNPTSWRSHNASYPYSLNPTILPIPTSWRSHNPSYPLLTEPYYPSKPHLPEIAQSLLTLLTEPYHPSNPRLPTGDGVNPLLLRSWRGFFHIKVYSHLIIQPTRLVILGQPTLHHPVRDVLA